MRLAAIVFTDIVGFSKLTEGDEVTGLELLAMQGDEEQAVMRGREAMALYPLAKNAINAQRIHIQMGSIYLQLGQVDKCIELLESIKDKLLGMEIGELKTDATWDPVRDHEIFKAIVQ